MRSYPFLKTISVSMIALGVSCNKTLPQVEIQDLPVQNALSQSQIPEKTLQVTSSMSFLKSVISVAGSHYQSCAPLLFPSQKPRTMIRKFYGKEESHTNLDQCVDRREANLDYVSFSLGNLEPSAGRLENDGGRINSFQRFNCSGFFAAIMAAGGFKYYQGQTSHFYTPTTADILKDFKRSDSCFFKPTLSNRESILPGDVLNISHGHVLQVFTVGADPLGLAQIKDKSQCNNISQKSFDFTYIHSTSNDKTPGFNGVLVEKASEASTSMIAKLAKFTRELCLSRFQGEGFEGVLADRKVGVFEKEFWILKLPSQDQIFSLRRHYGHSNKNCSFDPVSVKGFGCLSKTCFDAFGLQK